MTREITMSHENLYPTDEMQCDNCGELVKSNDRRQHAIDHITKDGAKSAGFHHPLARFVSEEEARELGLLDD